VPDFTGRNEKELLIKDEHSKSNPDRPSSLYREPSNAFIIQRNFGDVKGLAREREVV
jgi:hypothetical protein